MTCTSPRIAAPSLFLAFGMLLSAAASASDHGAAKPEPPPAKVATAQPTQPADPMDQLRQRLAERLSGGKPAAAPAEPAGDVQVMIKSAAPVPAPSAAKAAVHASAAPRRAAKAADKTAAADGHAEPHAVAHWDYKGSGGPQAWGGLKPEFSLCASGQRQSPIDIRGGLSVDLDPVRFDYKSSRFAVVDNGHTVQVNLAPGNTIEVGGKRFELLQFHFHRPSEERVDGHQFEMSLHLVHKDDQGRLAVVALLFDKGAAQASLQRVWNNLPLEKNEEANARLPLELIDLLPADRRYYTYMGSLTTPPCSEGVQWIVMRQPVTASAEQIEIFSRIYPMNSRPVQAGAGRRIMQSN